MQDWFNFLKSIYVFQCFNKLKKKKQITISIDAEKKWQNSTSIYDKKTSLSKLENNFFKLIKGIYEKRTANIILISFLKVNNWALSH